MANTISISMSMTTNLILDDFVTFFPSTLGLRNVRVKEE